jgi:hypothetical protein
MTQTVVFAAKDWDKAPIVMEKTSELVWDLNLYPRKMCDRKVVENYARALKAGCTFPNIKVGLLNGEKVIVDGVHRVKSRERLKIEYAACAELPFTSGAELFAEAVRCNSDHGKGFTHEDLQWSIKRLQKFKFRVSDIMALVHVPASEIYREAAAPITVLTTPSGKKVHCNVQKVDCDGKPNIRELIQFKNALMLIHDVAQKGCIPADDTFFKDLVTQCRLALGRVRFKVD